MVMNSNPELRKIMNKEKRDKPNSVLSVYLQEYENLVLEVIYDWLNNNGYIEDKIATLCFDGIMIKNNPEKVGEILSKLNEIVEEQTGFDLSFSQKKRYIFYHMTI